MRTIISHFTWRRLSCLPRRHSCDAWSFYIWRTLWNLGGTGFSLASACETVIGQGTWYDENDDRASAIAALRRGLDLGMNHIDTAEMYLSGGAEEWVAEAIAGRRDEVFLVSKVLPQNALLTPQERIFPLALEFFESRNGLL